MCYGYDGMAALRRSVIDRRGLLRGSMAAMAGVGLATAGMGATAAVAAPDHGTGPGPGHGPGPAGRRRVPPGLISIQLWTVRDALNGEPGYDATLRHLARIGYPKVELALGYFGRNAAQLRRFLDSICLKASSSHDGISADPAALREKIRNAVTLGQKFMVVPYLYSENADDWKRWAEQMNVEAAAAARAGLRYGYHNHAHEFTIDLGAGRTPWDVLTEELDPRLVHLEIDIYWAVTGGIESGDGVADPEGFTLDVIRAAPQRVLQYHVKDRHAADGDMADLGTGMIDFGRIFRKHSVLEYIVENDTPDVTPQQTAQVGYRYLRDLRY
ncbi:Sugar phosphate isomerase/epimerase [Micromonospora phaseoli]|uniref:Sugar phosphate isomerase/epimerase n=1 Tax=Micromonospora phaseoli TaxID=1144548 RepID=A0A1H6YHX7_9ACTN|nr:sugar phosphate isomerase/epimerase [Micromonospora phaseoli]PZW00052.1 sugar phosphate isomerase/epimerase [Micromonospora phaseoli]GIJ80406.1 sugar phosphate isomerase [Micromonospora phaseoli]SEJ36820.1 Sugar phosphate isomerase/epimerase [Micromonospora phaseoli]